MTSANDQVNLGVIGCGNRGLHVMPLFRKQPGVRVGAVCDIYGVRLDAAMQKAPGAQGFTDYRKLLDRVDIDAVLIGSPDHWHAQMAIDAMNAGKDVYVEKPLMRTIEEGPAIVKAARVNERICQVGVQQRSGWPYLMARDEYIRKGRLGKITLVLARWHSGPPRKINPPVMEKPSNLDWARFLGPVRWRDWNPYQYFSFRAFLDFNGGKMTDFGVHWIDAAQMMLDEDGPVSVAAAGGIVTDFGDGRDAPNDVHMLLEYPGRWTLQFDSGAFAPAPDYGIEVCGTLGRIFVNRGRFEFHPVEKGAPPVIERRAGDITADHVADFLACCRTRKRPNGDVWHGHRGTQAALLGVRSYIEKRRIHFDPAREEILPL